MPYQAIENYGVIGNMHTAALVGINGSIDWYCPPNFDSPSVFGAILDDVQGGRFQISPMADQMRCKQSYWPSTNILVTRFAHSDGIAELEDFMPVGLPSDSSWCRHVFRRIRCVRGAMRISLVCRPAFDYGRAIHETSLGASGAIFKSQNMSLALCSAIPLEEDGQGGVTADFVIEEGQSQVFALRDGDANSRVSGPPSAEEADELFQRTVKFWQHWISGCTYRGRWRELVERSALVLKLLTFEPTGAIVAAPTTSLPEVIGGTRNWDYRYTWLRDAAFTVYAFLRLGFTTEAADFVNWIQNCADLRPHAGKRLPVVFTIHGDSRLPEATLDHWEGYRQSKPVRVGNEAVEQCQNDIYGEVLDSLYLYNKYVSPIDYDFW